MKKVFFAAAAASLLAVHGAHAAAWISGTFDGQDYSTNKYDYMSTTFGQALDEGQSVSRTFTYNLTLHNDGLQFPYGSDRAWSSGCSPFSAGAAQCPPPFLSREQVQFEFDYSISRYADPELEYTINGATPDQFIAVTAGQTIHMAGSFTVTETNIQTDPFNPPGPFGIESAFFIYSAEWVDSVPVPEPAPALMVTAGVLLAAARRRRAISSS